MSSTYAMVNLLREDGIAVHLKSHPNTRVES